MKSVAKCSAFVRFSSQVHVKVCIPIPLICFFFFGGGGGDKYMS